MRITTLIMIICTLFLASCLNNEGEQKKANAKVIDFNPDKCVCCWGWTIVMTSDTLKSASGIISGVVGHDINSPIPVFIELGEKTNDCSIPYYEIKSIEIINN